MPPAISVFIHLHITGVYQNGFQVSVKTCNPSATQPPALRRPHGTGDDPSKAQQWVQGSATDTVEHPWVFSETLSSHSRKDDTLQAIYSRTSATPLKCCILEFLYGYGNLKGASLQAPNFHSPNKKLHYDLGKICCWKSMMEIHVVLCWQKGAALQEQCRRCHTHLDLATTRRSVKRKRCRSWVCRPVFSCTWPSRMNVRLWHMNDCTRGHASGLMGEKQPSLRKEIEGIKESESADCLWVRTGQRLPTPAAKRQPIWPYFSEKWEGQWR